MSGGYRTGRLALELVCRMVLEGRHLGRADVALPPGTLVIDRWDEGGRHLFKALLDPEAGRWATYALDGPAALDSSLHPEGRRYGPP